MNQTHYDQYLEDHDELNLYGFRFPGGAIAENGVISGGRIIIGPTQVPLAMLNEAGRANVAYDLRFPELMNPAILAADVRDGGDNRVATLSDLFAEGHARQQPVDIILPIQRYTGNFDITIPAQRAQMEAMLRADVGAFLTRLRDGFYNNGDYPPEITFSLGNEDYGHPIAYAVVAGLMIDIINQYLGNAGPIDFAWSVGVQMGTGSGAWNSLLARPDRIADYFDANGNPRIPELNGLRFQDLTDLSYR